MQITAKAWLRYIQKLRKVNDAAADLMKQYLQKHPIITQADRQALIDYAYAIATKYGEGAAELACEMYDELGVLEDIDLPDALPAQTASYSEVAKAVNGTLKTGNPDIISGAIERLVKKASVDTTRENAERDQAEWAWIPSGDTCAFCIMLASNGWQRVSEDDPYTKREHIHSNCDCMYAVRHSEKTTYGGYNPKRYKKIYDDAEGATWQEKLDSMRRDAYAANKVEINEQKRAAYEKRKERESSAAEEIDAG